VIVIDYSIDCNERGQRLKTERLRKGKVELKEIPELKKKTVSHA